MVHLVFAVAVLIALAGRRKSKYVFAAACFVLFLFAALRYMYGNDYLSYYIHYLNIQGGGESVYDEWLFTILNRVSPSFYFMIAVTSAVFIYSIYRLITGTLSTEYIWMGLLIFVINPYLFLMNLSAIRQCMAMVFFIAAVHFAVERKLWSYILMIVVGVLFHKSALLLMPVWFIARTKRVPKRLVCSVVLLLFMLMFVVNIKGMVLTVAELFDDSNYIYYISKGNGNSLRATLLTAISFVYVLGNLPWLEGKTLVCSKLYLIGQIFGILAYHVSMLTRYQMYFDIFSIVAIPAIIQNTQSRGAIMVNTNNVLETLWDILNKFVLPVLVFLVYVLRYYAFFNNPSWTAFFTYQSILSIM